MGEPFRSFHETWSHFVSRTEPFESFLDGFPVDEAATALVWLVVPDAGIARAALAVQRRLPRLPWLVAVPAHFLHVTLREQLEEPDDSAANVVAAGREALGGLEPFSLRFPRLNCFHEAIVAEAEGDGVYDAASRLRDGADFFLPHLSLAYTAAPGPPEPVREALEPIRATSLGEQHVREVLLCRIPASRTTILSPWTVVDRIALAG